MPPLPFPEPRWEGLPAPDPADVARLERALSLPRAVCALLAARGLTDAERAKAFLRPRLEARVQPRTLADAVPAVERLLRAIEGDETVLVHGDYDVDGMAGTALLTRWLRRVGARRVIPFAPHRMRHGYDFGPGGLERAREVGASLVVTVDCGVRALDTVRRARSEGIDVIVTDHHAPGPELPDALAVVNPNRPDCPYPDGGLAGAGVAYRLCELLAEARGVGADELHADLDLVALATVADLVPLEGENRTLVRYGLRALERTEKPGLRALLAVAGVSGSVDAGQVGFRLAPRLNAIGRMGDPADGLALLLAEDEREARALAERADQLNRRRQDEERRTLDQVLDRLADGAYDPARDFGVVVAGEGWHPGVIGIVASRVVERIYRPTVLVALDGAGGGRGSARSVAGFDLLAAITACGEHLERFGGHRQAAGMDVRADRVDAFREAFNREAAARFEGRAPQPVVRVDLDLDLGDATREAAHYLTYLGPFGIGNPRPVFAVRGARLERAREVGTGHLRVRLAAAGGGSLDAVGFGLAERLAPAEVEGALADAAFQLRLNEFRGRTRVEAHLRDLRLVERGEGTGAGGAG